MVHELEALYRRRLTQFCRTASLIAGDRELGREAVQEAFATALKERRRFRGEGTLEAWVWRIVINAARDARGSAATCGCCRPGGYCLLHQLRPSSC